MARPKKDPASLRTIRLEVRLTPTEEQTLLGRAQERGLTVSDLVRLAALSVKPRSVRANPERAALIAGLASLGKIGSNVNQIARALNRRETGPGDVPVPSDLIGSVLAYLETLSSNLIHELQRNGH